MKPDNKPAFPRPFSHNRGNGEDFYDQQGMTLRDYFAEGAMKSILIMDGMPYLKNYEIHAEQAYKQADAMMKERAKS